MTCRLERENTAFKSPSPGKVGKSEMVLRACVVPDHYKNGNFRDNYFFPLKELGWNTFPESGGPGHSGCSLLRVKHCTAAQVQECVEWQVNRRNRLDFDPNRDGKVAYMRVSFVRSIKVETNENNFKGSRGFIIIDNPSEKNFGHATLLAADSAYDLVELRDIRLTLRMGLPNPPSSPDEFNRNFASKLMKENGSIRFQNTACV